MNTPPYTPAPPSRSLMLLEARAAVDFARMLRPLTQRAGTADPGSANSLVIVVPGFGSGDGYTAPLRRYLRRRGFDAEGWGLGTNLGGSNLPHTLDDLSERWEFDRPERYRGEAGVPYLADRLYDRVLERHCATGKKVALIGWSLGGVLAREVARDLPELVTQVITMGTPVEGGPKYTAVAPLFRSRGQNLDWIEAEIKRRATRPIRQPLTAIVSRTDGIVGYEATRDRSSPQVRHIDIDASHLGMGFNPEIWSIIVETLSSER